MKSYFSIEDNLLLQNSNPIFQRSKGIPFCFNGNSANRESMLYRIPGHTMFIAGAPYLPQFIPREVLIVLSRHRRIRIGNDLDKCGNESSHWVILTKQGILEERVVPFKFRNDKFRSLNSISVFNDDYHNSFEIYKSFFSKCQ